MFCQVKLSVDQPRSSPRSITYEANRTHNHHTACTREPLREYHLQSHPFSQPHQRRVVPDYSINARLTRRQCSVIGGYHILSLPYPVDEIRLQLVTITRNTCPGVSPSHTTVEEQTFTPIASLAYKLQMDKLNDQHRIAALCPVTGQAKEQHRRYTAKSVNFTRLWV